MSKPMCVSRDCNTEPCRRQRLHGALSGLRVCAACRARLREDLLELPGLYAECESLLAGGFTPWLERVTGSRQATGLLLNEEAVGALSNILAVLAPWSG